MHKTMPALVVAAAVAAVLAGGASVARATHPVSANGELAFGMRVAHGDPASRERYSLAVAKICSGALLFEHAHDIGSDAGARAAAQDIRRSARRRLARVAAIPAPPELTRVATRWIGLQRRLAESYATNWMRIHYAIDAAKTPRQRARLPKRLWTFVHAPDPLRLASRRLELVLDVPDCTGGDPGPPVAA